MKRATTYQLNGTVRPALFAKLRDVGILMKFKLTLLVVFTAVVAALIIGADSWMKLLLLAVGGFLVAGAANTLNQILERDYDKLMDRTKNRPLAAGRMMVSEAVMLSGFLSLIGITLLALLHPLAALLGMVSLISYAFIYTPLKRITPLSVFVGAIPGALPILIGTSAFEGHISLFALCLFGIQFFWQFPHFWAIAWIADEDYKRAGYRLLPSKNGAKNSGVGMISFIYCLALMAVSVVILILGMNIYLWAGLMIVNAVYGYYSFKLYQNSSDGSARKLMFASFVYLPIVLGLVYWGM